MPQADDISDLKRVVLAISSFRSDKPVLATLSKIFSDGASPFAGVIVVDSLGSGQIAAAVREHGWPVIYKNAKVNLGSAGNLARRLTFAANMDADWCYAINHDGYVDVKNVLRATRFGNNGQRVGAVYPLLRYTERGRLYDAPRTDLFPFVKTLREPPDEQYLEVAWGSSNMALYNLTPIRQGGCVWEDLWMGWEDLGYGGLLTELGWTQYVDAQTIVDESYEYKSAGGGWCHLFMADKPTFYAYYKVRNLLLIRKRLRLEWRFFWYIVLQLLREHAVTLMFRKHRRDHLALLWAGVFDGLRGTAGRGPVP
jgi:hypothetical protein